MGSVAVLFLTLFLFTQQIKTEVFDSFINETSLGESKLGGKCNWFRGKWVYDASYPLYDPSTCPFIDPQFNCQKHGRSDKLYQKYRWMPFSCPLPRFNGLDFLKRYNGKKIMFVGDSLSLNQFNSLACMIHASVPKSRTTFRQRDALSSVTFENGVDRFFNTEGPFYCFHHFLSFSNSKKQTISISTKDYGLELYLYRTAYLVDLDHEKAGRVLKLDSITNGDAWRGMDALIFNTWHWWTHTGNAQPWDYVQENNKLYKDMNRFVAFYKGLQTWARWVEKNVNPTQTKVFFLGISPVHYQGRDWNEPAKSCMSEKEPFFGLKYPGGTPMAWVIVSKVLRKMSKAVYFLDVTTLSQYRKDAHPEGYSGVMATDCSHWCLPGLPDTWNQLLYAALTR